MAQGKGKITFDVPDNLTKEAIDHKLDNSYGNPVVSRVLEAARAQVSDPNEIKFGLTIEW